MTTVMAIITSATPSVGVVLLFHSIVTTLPMLPRGLLLTSPSRRIGVSTLIGRRATSLSHAHPTVHGHHSILHTVCHHRVLTHHLHHPLLPLIFLLLLGLFLLLATLALALFDLVNLASVEKERSLVTCCRANRKQYQEKVGTCAHSSPSTPKTHP